MYAINLSSIVAASGIDILIVVLILLNVRRGRELGVVRQILSDIGFFLGCVWGVQLVPYVVVSTITASERAAVTFATILGVGLFLWFIGDRAGLYIRNSQSRYSKLYKTTSVLGSILSGTTSIALVWLLSGIAITISGGWLASGLQQSLVIRALISIGPPIPAVISHLETYVDPNGSPQVFEGLEPIPPTSATNIAEQAAVNKLASLDGESIVRVEGLGCGGLVIGSGFIVAPGVVMTAAHVVAGVMHPFVIDVKGIQGTTVIWFDSQTDVALLRVRNLTGRSLRLTLAQARGTKAVVLGYPEGEAFTGIPAAIMASNVVSGRNIYDHGKVSRSIYSLESNVMPGDSGGPVVLADGSVAGMVISKSLLYNNLGYALTDKALQPALTAGSMQTRGVSTGSCPPAD